MDSIEARMCANCGGTKFKSYRELDHDGKMLARVRRRAKRDKQESVEEMVCTVCFSSDEVPKTPIKA